MGAHGVANALDTAWSNLTMERQQIARLTAGRRSNSALRGHRRRLRIEPLEERRLLAALTVNSTLDNIIAGDSLVTLREAIIAANTDTATDSGQLANGADTIEFDPAVFGSPQTITLALGQLSITSSLAIHGTGAANLTIDGNQASRIFNVDDGISTTHQSVEIAGMTLTGGKMASIQQGGAISSLEILTVSDSVITGNMAGSGGGIHIQALSGASTIQNSTVSGNTSTNVEGGGGGGGIRAAIYSGASLTIVNAVVSGNSAGIDGGGLLANTLSDASLTLQDSTFSGNSTNYRGGGISIHTYVGATTTIQSCTISGNSSIDGADNSGGGGGIYSRNFGTVTIQGSTLSGNSAKYDGGGVYSHSVNTGTTTIQNCTLSANFADRDGGGIWSYNSGALAIKNCTVTANSADADSNGTGSGGGIRSSSGSVSLQNTILAANNDNSGTAPDVAGSVVAIFSLVGNNTGSALVEAPLGSPDASGNLIGGPIHGTINPLIAALANNGGPTQTHALLAGSPAIDTGDPSFVGPPTFDQRGAPHSRVRNGGVGGLRVDMGAFEFQAFLPGDYDHDNDVDADDYGVWKQNFGSTSMLFADGNGNGRVDAADYTVWRNNLGAMAAAGGGSAAAAEVPSSDSEPIADATAIVGEVQPQIGIVVATLGQQQSRAVNSAVVLPQRLSIATGEFASGLLTLESQQPWAERNAEMGLIPTQYRFEYRSQDIEFELSGADDVGDAWKGLACVDCALEDLFGN